MFRCVTSRGFSLVSMIGSMVNVVSYTETRNDVVMHTSSAIVTTDSQFPKVETMNAKCIHKTSRK